MTLYRCVRCRLVFGHEEDGLPNSCPQCRLRNNLPPKIVVAGRDVTPAFLRDYGRRDGLSDERVRRGLAAIPLGHCPHGWITALLCTDGCI